MTESKCRGGGPTRRSHKDGAQSTQQRPPSIRNATAGLTEQNDSRDMDNGATRRWGRHNTAGLTKQNDSRESQWRHPTTERSGRGVRLSEATARQEREGKNHVMHHMIITRKLARTGLQSVTPPQDTRTRAQRGGRGVRNWTCLQLLCASFPPPPRRHPRTLRGAHGRGLASRPL